MHGLDMMPLTHPNGYRQVMFMDYKNEFGKGNTALYLHTSPHKQYYVFIASCLEDWMADHLEKLEKKITFNSKWENKLLHEYEKHGRI